MSPIRRTLFLGALSAAGALSIEALSTGTLPVSVSVAMKKKEKGLKEGKSVVSWLTRRL